jgi:hypothetical protein
MMAKRKIDDLPPRGDAVIWENDNMAEFEIAIADDRQHDDHGYDRWLAVELNHAGAKGEHVLCRTYTTAYTYFYPCDSNNINCGTVL